MGALKAPIDVILSRIQSELTGRLSDVKIVNVGNIPMVTQGIDFPMIVITPIQLGKFESLANNAVVQPLMIDIVAITSSAATSENQNVFYSDISPMGAISIIERVMDVIETNDSGDVDLTLNGTAFGSWERTSQILQNDLFVGFKTTLTVQITYRHGGMSS